MRIDQRTAWSYDHTEQPRDDAAADGDVDELGKPLKPGSPPIDAPRKPAPPRRGGGAAASAPPARPRAVERAEAEQNDENPLQLRSF